MADPLTKYYLNQAGRGGIENVYSGASYQRGHGIGSFLSGIFRSIAPLFLQGSKAVGSEILRTAGNVVADMTKQTPLKQSIKSRLKEAGQNLNSKFNDKIESLVGNGFKRSTNAKSRHSSSKRGRVKKPTKKVTKINKVKRRKISTKSSKYPLPRDIFS